MTDSKDIVARLRSAGDHMLSLGLKDVPITHKAADRIEALEAEVAKLRAALEPFARAAEIKLCGGDFWTDDKFIQSTDVAFHVRFGDLRRARAALEGQK